jgi:hypothetical protein
LQRIDMTRFVLELKGPAEGDLATLGRAQSKVIVGLDDEITALVKKAATFGLTLTGEPRFVLEHKKPALPGNPGGPAPLPSSVEVADLDEKRAADGGATVHPRRHGSAAAAE